jgi:LmbE family N-acetylglucosaminyl deacetylase
MMAFRLQKSTTEPLTILCIGAHSDDIEIGCGGTILRLLDAPVPLKLHWVVLSACGVRGEEARRAADLFAPQCDRHVVLQQFRDGFMPYDGAMIKEFFEDLKCKVDPDLIFTHWQGDAHQDHRLVSSLTWNTFRNHMILEYEIPKYDGDLGNPNVFNPLDEKTCTKKIDRLIAAFPSQTGKPWFQRETFSGLMRIRGMECNAPDRYAEAFYSRKLVLGSLR